MKKKYVRPETDVCRQKVGANILYVSLYSDTGTGSDAESHKVTHKDDDEGGGDGFDDSWAKRKHFNPWTAWDDIGWK